MYETIKVQFFTMLASFAKRSRTHIRIGNDITTLIPTFSTIRVENPQIHNYGSIQWSGSTSGLIMTISKMGIHVTFD